MQDVRNRQLTVSRLVSFDIEVDYGTVFVLVVANPGSHPAENVELNFSDKLDWPEGVAPYAIQNGIRYLPPGRKLRFWYGQGHKVLKDDYTGPLQFSVTATYTHPELEERHSEEFVFDFRDFLGSVGGTDPFDNIHRELKKGLRAIVHAINSVAHRIK